MEVSAQYDPINPKHYQTPSGIEAIDVIEQYGLGYHLGNAMKYLLRAGRKDPAREREDLEKARWYLKRWLGLDITYYGHTAHDVRPGPDEVVEAFGLLKVGGARRVAVQGILQAALEERPLDRRGCIEHALWALEIELA